MSSLSLRPGIVHGDYPERKEGRIDQIAASLVRLTDKVSGRKYAGSRYYNYVVDLVHHYAQPLEKMDEIELNKLAKKLRKHFLKFGLTDNLIARSFALVSEVSYRTIGKRHFDVQLYGGWLMIKGMLAEMDTGEGKTLTATLPACTAALAGTPVHIISANDYLVSRDAEIMAPIYHALGLSVGTITEDMDLEMRRKNYACDITYCSNKQIVFDYLRDRLTMGQVRDRRQLELERLYKDEARIDQLLLRGLCFAIVDEADSVLIDEARTPLVISKGSSNDAQELAYQEALDLAKQLQEGDDFYILGREHRVVLREEGCIRLEQLSHSLSAIWLGEKRREFLITQALSAIYLYHSNKQYIVKNDKVHIVDEYTGRAMEDRAWEQGLHQMIEAKEGCEITGNREVLAKISYQKFFRRYLQLAGMTGTGSEVAAELRSVYGLRVVHVPQNKKPQRVGYKDQVFWKRDDKWQAVVERIKAVHKKGQPVLVGTRSVADSEYVSELLRQEKLPYCVLNARNDHQEAEIIAQAGQRTRITVATNMAGRGTDISLGPGVEELGGLHVIATERHDSHRIDRQLFGRCGRQGDPGSYEVILSLEDELVMLYLPQLIYEYIQKHPKNNSSAGEFGRLMIVLAQRLAEQRHRQTRHQLMKLDLQMGDKLAFTGFIE